MECLGKSVWNYKKIIITPPDNEIYKKIIGNWDGIAKPIDSLGDFETHIAKIGAILRNEHVDIEKKAVLIMCADNGIVEEGISQSGQEVTLAVVKNMGLQNSSVGKMAKNAGVDTFPVDIGINSEQEIKGVLNKKITMGTKNFMKEPAMTDKQMMEAIDVGIDMVRGCKNQGYTLLATGEMGIGNTTTSSAVAAALLGCDVSEVTGRGAGLNDEEFEHKKRVIADAILRYDLKGKDVFYILKTVGGLDIAGLAGVCIGGAIYHIPIVLDGVISVVAALVADSIVPGVRDYLIPSHAGKEPAMKKMCEKLGLKPVIYGNMALGEGTGAVMMFALLDMIMCIYKNGSTFYDIQIEQYERYRK